MTEIEELGTGLVVAGFPTRNEASTIGQVTAADNGLGRAGLSAGAVLVNADNDSLRTTRRAAGVVSIGVSGPDNVGKSTQIRLLARQAGVVSAGPLDGHDPRWADTYALGLADWWFGRASLEQVVDVLACSYLARAAAAAPAGSVRLMDRGLPMLEASVVATAAVREDLGYEAAVQRAAGLLTGYRRDLARAEAAEWGMLLLHAAEPSAGGARALAREHEVTASYAAYQRILNTHLCAQASTARPPRWRRWSTGCATTCSPEPGQQARPAASASACPTCTRRA